MRKGKQWFWFIYEIRSVVLCNFSNLLIYSFNDTYQELQKQTEDYATQVSNEVMNGASLPSETDMQTHVFEIYHDILRNYLDQGMKYGDPETITVHVNKDDKNVYTIADEDISKIDGKVMAMDVIEQ